MALQLDINEIADASADVPGMFAHYFVRVCEDMTENEEEYIIAQKSNAINGPNLRERLRLLTGLNESTDNPIDLAIGLPKSPWSKLFAVQKRFDSGQHFFNFENYVPLIQAFLDRLASVKDEDARWDPFGDIVEIIDKISSSCKRRVLSDSKQAAFETYMYIIKATERCIRYKGERWDFSAVVDTTQLAIFKLLDPNSMDDLERRGWMANPSLNKWLYLMGKQNGWHLRNMTRVIDQFHGMEDLFAHQLGNDEHQRPARG